MEIHISSEPFDIWPAIQAYQDFHLKKGSYGALSLFVGTMRDFNVGDDITAMHIEYYEEMTEKHLKTVVHNLTEEHPVEEVLVVHRIGTVYPGDPIVVVAVWSAHRREAYAVNQGIIESLKSKAPFWKKESLSTGERWVEATKEESRI